MLGVLLMFVLAGPLAAVGAYLTSTSPGEVAAEQAFASKQRILDADRLFRHELAARLCELAEVLGSRAERIRTLAENAERRVGSEAAWYSAVQLTDDQIATLKLYDDLVWERVRWLGAHADESAVSITEAVAQLERAMDERMDLLVRGRQAPTVAPSALLAASTPAADIKGSGGHRCRRCGESRRRGLRGRGGRQQLCRRADLEAGPPAAIGC